MKKSILCTLTILLLCSSCTNTIAMMTKKFNKLQTIVSKKTSDFWYNNDNEPKLIVTAAEFYGEENPEFIPLDEGQINLSSMQSTIAQPSITPGKDSSPIPSIQSFKSPSSSLATLFKTIHFHEYIALFSIYKALLILKTLVPDD